MKQRILSIIIVLTAFLLSEKANAQQAANKMEYNFPEQMAPDIKAEYQKLADKGLALYQLACAQCHGKKSKGKEFIPDFTVEQLELYQIRVANATHETQLTDAALSAEELSLITTFFMYKKKNEGKNTAKRK